MPRQRRVYEPGLSHHVIQRGNNRGDIFVATADYWRLLTLVGAASRREQVDVHGFVLMTNHFHLLVTPQGKNALPRFMQRVDSLFAQYYNREYARIGTFWNGRYNGIPIGDERQWLTCLRYIEQNPVRAHMVEAPDRYQWSSYKAHAAGATWPSWLKPHRCYLQLGPNPVARQAAYRAICDIRLSDNELRILRRPPRRDIVHDLSAGADAGGEGLTRRPDPSALNHGRRRRSGRLRHDIARSEHQASESSRNL
jgi:putative transposase